MAPVNDSEEVDELYVLARRVLLDALHALEAHREALVLVGAQAVYLRTGEDDLAVAPYTTDGDIAIEPDLLSEIPRLERALEDAGFQLEGSDVGIWRTRRDSPAYDEPVTVQVDLLTARSSVPNRSRKKRAAKIQGHDERAVRIATGLGGATVDFDRMTLGALEHTDSRRVELRVAGPAALLVAKLHKIEDRLGKPLLKDKDALDILRLLRATETSDVSNRLRVMAEDPRSAAETKKGIELLGTYFGDRRGAGIGMAVRAVGTLGNEDEIAESCIVLANDLLESLR